MGVSQMTADLDKLRKKAQASFSSGNSEEALRLLATDYYDAEHRAGNRHRRVRRPRHREDELADMAQRTAPSERADPRQSTEVDKRAACVSEPTLEQAAPAESTVIA